MKKKQQKFQFTYNGLEFTACGNPSGNPKSFYFDDNSIGGWLIPTGKVFLAEVFTKVFSEGLCKGTGRSKTWERAMEIAFGKLAKDLVRKIDVDSKRLAELKRILALL
jgi:hypothetical protein